MRSIRDIRVAGASLLCPLLFLVGCTTPMQQYALNDLALSCDEANRAAYNTLSSMGFTITAFTPAAMGKRGEVRATRTATESAGGDQHATVTIECGPTGTAVNASEDGKWLGQLEFKRGFYLSFTSTLAMDARRRELEEKAAHDTSAAAAKPITLQVLVEPIRGQAAKLDFEIDMAAGGVLPVRVHVKNPTTLRYEVDPTDIRLTRTDGERVPPLSVAEAAARISGANDPTSGRPVSSLSRAELDERLERMRFSATEIGPQSEAKGYLYFPLAAYTRARVVMTESESEEAEGFVVEF